MWAVWRVLHLPEISIRTIDQKIHGIVLNKKVYTFLSPHYVLKRVRRKIKERKWLVSPGYFLKKKCFSVQLPFPLPTTLMWAEQRGDPGKGRAWPLPWSPRTCRLSERNVQRDLEGGCQ